MKREHAIEIEGERRKFDEKVDEIDYLNEKVAKLEHQNKELRLAKDPSGGIKKLETEIAFLKS